MKRHRTHQIDELAQQVFRAAIPTTWTYNEQHNDYGKDYLVEVGDEDGEQTGLNFFVQLKGQEEVEFTGDISSAKFSLEAKHAAYYVDKIKDLPVFLVVVDVNAKKGWYHFLQPGLERDQSWRKQDSVTIYLPTKNDLTDKDNFRRAIEGAKRTMRLLHPESIHDAATAHKARMVEADPRFDVKVSLVNEHPQFTLLPRQPVPITFTFKGDSEAMSKKVTDLIDKGLPVTFDPGEMSAQGSRLFDKVAGGCMVQAKMDLPGTVTLVCRDAAGTELARLGDVPGRFTGGQKECWFDGALGNSPLTLRIGPMAPGLGGSVQLNVSLRRWDGQRLRQLAYFNRVLEFFQAVPKSGMTEVECHQDGNRVFAAAVPLHTVGQCTDMADYFDVIGMARAVAEKLSVNPVWTQEGFDTDTWDTVQQLHALFFSGGWTQPMPEVCVELGRVDKAIKFDAETHSTQPGNARLVSDCTCLFLGEKIPIGVLVFDYTEVTLRSKDQSGELVGSPGTMMSVCLASQEEAARHHARKDVG